MEGVSAKFVYICYTWVPRLLKKLTHTYTDNLNFDIAYVNKTGMFQVRMKVEGLG
jgi:hypothetical protein